ncbi:hypothetical protein RFI_15457, partial [Reticulomyxa filosa]
TFQPRPLPSSGGQTKEEPIKSLAIPRKLQKSHDKNLTTCQTNPEWCYDDKQWQTLVSSPQMTDLSQFDHSNKLLPQKMTTSLLEGSKIQNLTRFASEQTLQKEWPVIENDEIMFVEQRFANAHVCEEYVSQLLDGKKKDLPGHLKHRIKEVAEIWQNDLHIINSRISSNDAIYCRFAMIIPQGTTVNECLAQARFFTPDSPLKDMSIAYGFLPVHAPNDQDADNEHFWPKALITRDAMCYLTGSVAVENMRKESYVRISQQSQDVLEDCRLLFCELDQLAGRLESTLLNALQSKPDIINPTIDSSFGIDNMLKDVNRKDVEAALAQTESKTPDITPKQDIPSREAKFLKHAELFPR